MEKKFIIFQDLESFRKLNRVAVLRMYMFVVQLCNVEYVRHDP